MHCAGVHFELNPVKLMYSATQVLHVKNLYRHRRSRELESEALVAKLMLGGVFEIK